MATLTLALSIGTEGRVLARVSPRPASPIVIVFDVETDGATPKPRVVEMGFVVLSGESLREEHSYSQYWRLSPEGRINPHAQAVHGISLGTLSRLGVDPRDGLSHFMGWIRLAKASPGSRVVAHNAAFDAKMIQNTLEACGLLDRFGKEDCFCTMQQSAPKAGCRDVRGKPKNPKNAELYQVLHGTAPDWAHLHSALDDARVTAMNYRAGLARGWWPPVG